MAGLGQDVAGQQHVDVRRAHPGPAELLGDEHHLDGTGALLEGERDQAHLDELLPLGGVVLGRPDRVGGRRAPEQVVDRVAQRLLLVVRCEVHVSPSVPGSRRR